APKDALTASPFRDSWVEGRIPKRAVLAAALWHAAILALPFSLFTAVPHRNPLLQNVELTWQGPIDDLPLLEIVREKPKPAPAPKPKSPEVKPEEVPPQPAVDAFHPRQRIFTDPVHPTHPRQTLINPAAPFEPPKMLPNLPNIVQFQQAAVPARPRLQISAETLKKLRPRQRRVKAGVSAALPDVPNMEPRAADLSIPATENAPARPKLEIHAGAAPRVAPRA